MQHMGSAWELRVTEKEKGAAEPPLPRQKKAVQRWLTTKRPLVIGWPLLVSR